eukprot:TRINITY_DN15394_c0_g1_i1.p1 TRINITY_DN15394_c0_g1~~TRINITY_DN15394_c0_g1_i1.p1  ORF type:complete len:478 (+),score=151.72 TRINITY_DN15394_c0_g1_i1:196-1434(+)
MTLELKQMPGLTPLIFITIEGTKADAKTVLMYGHLDKQPPLTETWAEGLHPYKPVVRDGKLYGRGGADDGYAICAALLSIEALQRQGIDHDRIVVMIEASEESGSHHLPLYVEHLEPEIGSPSLIICLDSGCGNYSQFWVTTSLRGLVVVDLTVKILEEGAHSGNASGVVPSSFRIIRQLLDRIEDPETGKVKVAEFSVEIPEDRLEQAKKAAQVLGNGIYTEFSFVEGSKPVEEDVLELLLNKTWRPALSVTGVNGLPSLEKAGNVLRPFSTLKLSIRVPPTADAPTAALAVKEVLEKDPPYGAQVSVKIEKKGSGWNAPTITPWLLDSINKSSAYFCNGNEANFRGEGGSIPFMGMLGKKFPEAQFVVTGLLGPESNAHGPNEFLHIAMGKAVTSCVASILADHCKHYQQ